MFEGVGFGGVGGWGGGVCVYMVDSQRKIVKKKTGNSSDPCRSEIDPDKNCYLYRTAHVPRGVAFEGASVGSIIVPVKEHI